MLTRRALPPVLLACLLGAVRPVTIDNLTPRRDTSGNIVNAHDGHVFVDPTSAGSGQRRRFLWVGTSYPPCLDSSIWGSKGNAWKPDYNGCGFGDHNYAMYSSPDLASWTLLNPSCAPALPPAFRPGGLPPQAEHRCACRLIPADRRPIGIYFRPKLLYCKARQHWVLWFNYVDLQKTQTLLPTPAEGVYGVAVSKQMAGPYEIVGMNLTMGNGRNLNGDFNLFEDSDGSAYILYHSYDWSAQPPPFPLPTLSFS